MNKCIMCKREVHSDIGYVTDGKIYICAACEETHSLSRILTRITNSGVDSNLVEVFSQPIESEIIEAGSSLVDQTNEQQFPQGYIPDCPFHPCDTCHFYYGEIDSCMVGEYDYTPTEEEYQKLRAAYGDEGAKDFFKPSQAVSEYNEINDDIMNMSHEDFFSKYADNPNALQAYVDMNGEPSD